MMGRVYTRVIVLMMIGGAVTGEAGGRASERPKSADVRALETLPAVPGSRSNRVDPRFEETWAGADIPALCGDASWVLVAGLRTFVFRESLEVRLDTLEVLKRPDPPGLEDGRPRFGEWTLILSIKQPRGMCDPFTPQEAQLMAGIEENRERFLIFAEGTRRRLIPIESGPGILPGREEFIEAARAACRATIRCSIHQLMSVLKMK